MMARLYWCLDPLSHHQFEKKPLKIGPSQTKLSGSAHVVPTQLHEVANIVSFLKFGNNLQCLSILNF